MILNVDDDAASRYAKTRILKRAGYDVIEAGTGQDALTAVKESRPKLVLLDVKLPDINGLEVCRRIKDDPQSSHTMVLQISASYVTVPDRIHGLDCGADTYLTEPVENAELVATVRALMRLYEREEENRQLLAQLREADRQKDDFLAILAHELRNPLHPIRGAVEMLRTHTQLDPEIQLCRDIIDQQVQHLSRLIDDLLDVARITRDKLELRTENIELGEVVKRGVESTRSFFESHGQHAEIELPPTAVQIEADPVRLTQVLTNLLNNAAKYTPMGGKIAVRASVAGNQALISVQDNGVGIAAEQLPHVFEKFYQADRSLERSHFGLGLGLTLARRLVELHGGTAEARSEGLGKGSEFLITLPLRSAPASTPAAGRVATEQTGENRWRVLIIDDGARTREMYSMLLRKRGHEVESAPDGASGIELVEKFQPEIILLDVGMPRLNGFDTCIKIRELPRGKDIAIIAVTGWAQDEVQERADQAGFDGILVKPVGVQQILELASTLRAGKGSND
jgi:two-component system, sensor histidine kinase